MDNKKTTLDQPEIGDHPRCFKCERYVKCAVVSCEIKDYWEYPWGLVMDGGDNFGSSHYDSMLDGIMVRVIICDDCLKKHKDLLQERKDPVPQTDLSSTGNNVQNILKVLTNVKDSLDTPEKASDFLKGAGILNQNGNLSKRYGGSTDDLG